MIDYSTMPPVTHMFAMRLLNECAAEGALLLILTADNNHLDVKTRLSEDTLQRIAGKVGLVFATPNHLLIPQ